MIKTSENNNLLDMIKEAEKGMTKNVIYDTSNMQIIWHQIATHSGWIDKLLISMDECITFKSIQEHSLSVDTGEWYYSDPDNPWYFKWN